MIDKLSEIEAGITLIKQDNIRLKNNLEETRLNTERDIDALILEIIQVIDAYDKAEVVVNERGYNNEESANKAIKRMMQPKKVAMAILSKYNVMPIDIVGQMLDEDSCTVVDTEPDSSKDEGIVLSIEKAGYKRGDRLIRRAEVIIVKN